MIRSAQDAKRFVQELSALAERLAERDVVVAALHCEWSGFGSWTLEAQKGTAADSYAEALRAERWETSGPDVLRFSWDGRDRFLTIERAPTPPLSSPGPWTRQDDRAFDDRAAAIRFVEEQLSQWVSS